MFLDGANALSVNFAEFGRVLSCSKNFFVCDIMKIPFILLLFCLHLTAFLIQGTKTYMPQSFFVDLLVNKTQCYEVDYYMHLI